MAGKRRDDEPTNLTGMAGVIAIIVVLVLIPVVVLMGGGVASAVVGFFLGRNADAQHVESGGSRELLELDD